MSFVHLHTHSHYSFLDGLSNIPEMVALAASHGMPALALTDHGSLYGAVEFYKACKKKNIKPIIGMEAYVTSYAMGDRRPSPEGDRHHLTLLAKDTTGYTNLVKLVTAGHLHGFHHKPRIDKETLRAHAEGLICLSGCGSSELARALASGATTKAEEIAREYQDIFGKDNYYLEITHHPLVTENSGIREGTIALSRTLGIPLVATQDSHYLHAADVPAHEALLAVAHGADSDDARTLFTSGDDFSFIDAKTACEYFKDVPEAVENTLKIADRCNLEFTLGTWTFPLFVIPEGTTHDEELRRAAYAGLAFRGIEETPEVRDRIEYELGIIQKKGFSPYFLVVSDLLQFARTSGILTTTRGSAAGSFVSYLTGITNVDPLAFKLPFERFLNPERPSAPDIDMDFADTRRDEMVQYARAKYGDGNVAQIGTYGTMMARGSVRDVARATGHPYAVGDRISKLIPMGSQGFPMTIDRALEMIPELDAIYKQEDDAREIIDLARRLEGTVRHVSIHAAGVVISPRPLDEFIPVQYDPGGEKIITQYDMHCVEDMGLLKFDFLGLKNLSILADAIALVKKHHGAEIDIERIPMDDPATFKLLTEGQTMALFQLNGAGMTRYLKELKPTSIHDINAMVALYRPGPMAFIPDYIARKDDPSKITYLDPRMKNILEASYGIITYQDDILLMAIGMAGYSWGEADKFRKAIGKKIPEEMQAQKDKFMKGCIDGGMSKEAVHELWEKIETFAAYGFNKAHAASYGRVAYQTAYMKANYPAEYMTAILTADAGDVEKIAEFVAECRRMGIAVLRPDVNESEGTFAVVRDEAGKPAIRFGLYSIKNFGNEVADALIAERKKHGPFTSFPDMLARVNQKSLNKKSFEALIKCGALDALDDRGTMLENLDDLLAYHRQHGKASESQHSLFGLMADTATLPTLRLRKGKAVPTEEKLQCEKDLLGLYVSGHPLDKHARRIELLKLSLGRVRKYDEGKVARVAVIVEEVKVILTGKGEQMAFVKIADWNDLLEAVVFPRTYAEVKDLLVPNLPLLIEGKVSRRNDELSMLVESIKKLV